MSQYIKVPQGDSTKLSAPLCISSKSKAMGCSQQQGSYLRFHGEKGDVGKSYAKGKILVSHFFPLPKVSVRQPLVGASLQPCWPIWNVTIVTVLVCDDNRKS